MPKQRLTEDTLNALQQTFGTTKEALRRNASRAVFVGTNEQASAVEAARGGGATFTLGSIGLMDSLSSFDASVEAPRPAPVSDPVEMDDARALVLFRRGAERYRATKVARPRPPVEQPGQPPEAPRFYPLHSVYNRVDVLKGMCFVVAYEVTSYLTDCLRGSGFVVKSVCVEKAPGASFSSSNHYFTVVGRARQGIEGAIVVDATWAQFGIQERAIKDVKPLCITGGPASIISLGDFASHLGGGAGLMLERYRTGLSSLGR